MLPSKRPKRLNKPRWTESQKQLVLKYGGSEFMSDFEDACQKLNLPLIVLTASSPKYNVSIERGNRIFREEFYARKDLLSDSGAM
jgi:hypothetical protein